MTVERAWQELELRRELAHLRNLAGKGARSRMIGRATAMQRVFDLIDRVAPMRATVLVIGETGTRKELVARAITTSHRGRVAPSCRSTAVP